MATNANPGSAEFQKVCYFNVSVTDESDLYKEGSSEDGHLFEFGIEQQSRIFMEFEQSLKKTVGSEFRIEEFRVERGSLLMSFIVAGASFFKSDAGQVILDISRYEALIKSLTAFASQLKSVMGRIISRSNKNTVTTVTWQLSPTVTAGINRSLSPKSSMSFDPIKVLLFYVVGSHGVILVILLWLLVRHLP